MASIGSTNTVDCEYLFDIADGSDTNEPICIGEIDLDPYFVSAAHAERPSSYYQFSWEIKDKVKEERRERQEQ